jgi:hypothetical protein
LHGIGKRVRFILRIHAKSEFYDNFFTFFVLLSTVAMCLDYYGIDEETKNYLDIAN